MLRAIRCVSLGVAIAALAGCNPTYPLNSPATSVHAISPRADGVAPSASDNLLYVIDPGSMAAMEYTFKPAALRFAAILNGVQDPFGACVDASQNVWITQTGTLLARFAHGATSPDATLNVKSGSPMDCSVDDNTGDLAVLAETVIISTVDLFKGGRGRPAEIPLGRIVEAYCSYDGYGNLFVAGQSSGRDPLLYEIPNGGKSYKVISMNQAPAQPGGIAWDGTYLDIADSTIGAIDRFEVSGSSATLFDSIPLEATGMIGKFSVSGKYLVVPFQSGSNGFVNVYSYPAGGKRLRTLRSFSIPRAAIVSTGSKS
ncbi:MAG TPA: hypothetical protein VN936_03455 [Candidatus Acidoferrum sp.]|nr:hypothetical protein [Candidatus Acidoferrum sp.]